MDADTAVRAQDGSASSPTKSTKGSGPPFLTGERAVGGTQTEAPTHGPPGCSPTMLAPRPLLTGREAAVRCWKRPRPRRFRLPSHPCCRDSCGHSTHISGTRLKSETLRVSVSTASPCNLICAGIQRMSQLLPHYLSVEFSDSYLKAGKEGYLR